MWLARETFRSQCHCRCVCSGILSGSVACVVCILLFVVFMLHRLWYSCHPVRPISSLGVGTEVPYLAYHPCPLEVVVSNGVMVRVVTDVA